MANWGISEFFGCLFYFSFLVYLTFAFFDGLGVFRDAFWTGRGRG